MLRLRQYCLLILLVFGGVAKSQNYPVQTFVQVSPPHTAYLPDYADPFSNQMKVILTFTDFSYPSYNVKLRFKFEGNGYTITSGSLLPLPLFTISPGVPYEISGNDLAPYLASNNLIFSGINVGDYQTRKVLPEGPVTICVEVIDFSNPNQAVLSNPSCTPVWFSLNDPPLLNTPFCGNLITPSDPQQIIFSWTPLHMNSLNSAGTNYVFELFEIRPDNADPNQVVNSTLPIFMQVTDQTYINYGIIEPQLQLGMSYVWRVRAQDIQGRDFFRNNGYSTVCTFTYGNVAASLANGITLQLNSNGTGVRQGLAWWNASSTFTNYKVEVRKTGDPNYEWFPYDATGGDLKINGLEPNTNYECRVKGLIGNDYESEWSNTSTFKTQVAPDYACGSTSLPGKTQTIVPLTNAIAGLYFTVGQFEMQVKSIEPLNPISMPGHYKGLGTIQIPFALINLRVKFDDILVDENMMVRSGKVEAITQGIDAWLLELQASDPEFVDGVITDFDWSDSTSLTVWIDGEPQEFVFPENGVLVLQDEDGMKYTFNADGTWTVVSTLIYGDDVLAANKDYRVDFSAVVNQVFGFDQKKYAAWLSKYEVLLLTDSTNYFVPFKSLGVGEQDVVRANIKSLEVLNNVSFIADREGVITNLSATKLNDTTYQVALANINQNSFVYAVHNGNRIGKVWVKALPKIEKEIVLVPVNGASLTNINTLTTDLNQIYAQANVNLTVTVATNFQNSTWDLNNDNKLQNGDVTLMSHYSEEMRALRDAYFESDTAYNKKAYYLFVVPQFLNADLDGYMVRGKAVGFLKDGAYAHTAAHERAHGIVNLEHTFPEVTQGITNNLLDYTENSTNKSHLAQHQWKLIHDPLPAFSFLDEEEDGENQNEFNFEYVESILIQSINLVNVDFSCSEYFYTVYGHKIMVPENVKSYIKEYNIENNCLKGFWIEGKSGNQDGYYVATRGATTVELSQNQNSIQITSLTGSNTFVKFEGLEGECPYTNNPKSAKTCVRYTATLPNGDSTTLYKKIPSSYKFDFVSEPCNEGDQVIESINNNVAVCRALTAQECQGTTGIGGGNISPEDLVKLFELPENTIYGSNEYCWINAQGKAIKTINYSDLIVSNKLLGFKENGKTYVAIAVTKSGEDHAFGYIDKDVFANLKIELNNQVKVKHIDSLLYSSFQFAASGDIIHYRIFNSYGECNGFQEFELFHDNREKYTVKSNPSPFYYYDNVEATIVVNQTCSGEILSTALCDALSMGAQGIGNMVEYLFSVALIPPKYWDPLTNDYSPTAYNIYAAISTGIDFGLVSDQGRQVSFAYLCGLFNGIVKEIGGIGQAMAMFSQMVCDAQLRSQVFQAFTNISETISTLVLSFSEEWNIANEFQRGEISGRTTIAILSIVIPITKIKWATVVTKGINFIKVVSKEFLKFLKKVDDDLIAGFKMVGDDFKQLFYFPNGSPSYALASVSDDGTLTLTNSNRWFDSFEADDIVDDLGAVNYKLDNSSPIETDELVVVKKSESEVGFGKKSLIQRLQDLNDFIAKTYSQKLDHLSYIWATKYPIQEMLEGRSFFEDVMGHYRYTKSSGWAHTGDISPNFKGVDFYKNFTEISSDIYAETAVSMKTTITTNVNNWLNSDPIKKNIGFLEDALDPTIGLSSNGKRMFIQNAEIHLYMPNANITPDLKTEWLQVLDDVNPKIKFEIKSLEDFVN